MDGVKRIAAHEDNAQPQGFFVRAVRRNLICFEFTPPVLITHISSIFPSHISSTILGPPHNPFSPTRRPRRIDHIRYPPPHRNHAHLKERPCSFAPTPPPPPSIPQPRSPPADHHRCRSTASTRKPTRPGRAPPSRPTATPSKRPRPCQRYVNRPDFPRIARVCADDGVVGGFSARIA